MQVGLIIKGYPSAMSTKGSHVDEKLALSRGWLHHCETAHPRCQRNSNLWYPTRLLHIGRHGRKVKLVISAEEYPSGPYMTLSHRWGSHPYTKLLNSTLVQMKRGINIAQLPQVFQDAITITAQLGVHYLWIDSLCIKQDPDLVDWKLEAVSMGKVYANSYLNISATFSRSGDEALFRPSTYTPFLPTKFNIIDDDKCHQVYAFDGDMWLNEISQAPLSERGWVFQERFLSPRILHFGQRQMAWECNESKFMEVFPDGVPPTCTVILDKELTLQQLKTSGNTTQDAGFSFIKQWQEIVTEYSKCIFTYYKDKVVAFAGIAETVAFLRKDVYVAGTWQHNVLYDLPWWRSPEDRDMYPIDETRARAPSWSWLSVDGEINFPAVMHRDPVRRQFMEIVGFTKTSEDHINPFIFTESGLYITGMIATFDAEFIDDEVVRITINDVCFNVDEDQDDVHVDLEISTGDTQKLCRDDQMTFMPLFTTSYHLYGILLIPDTDKELFRRVGAVEIETMKVQTRNSESEARHQNNDEILSEHVDSIEESRNIWVRSKEREEQDEALDCMFLEPGIVLHDFLISNEFRIRMVIV
jgi:hypothetical protein